MQSNAFLYYPGTSSFVMAKPLKCLDLSVAQYGYFLVVKKTNFLKGFSNFNKFKLKLEQILDYA